MFVPPAEQRAHATVPASEVPSIDALEFRSNSHIYLIGGEPLPYAAFLKAPVAGAPLLVFGQGAQDRSSVVLPRFQRMDWAFRLPYNVLIFSDPTLHLGPNVTLGWCLGNEEHYVLPRLQAIIEKVRGSLRIENRNILFYGSSAGGFTSLMLASRFEGSSALVNNPQTDILKFRRGGVRGLLKLGFSGISIAKAYEQFGERVSFVEAIRRGSHVPRIYYLQNILDQDHFEDQMMPLIKELQRLAGDQQLVDLSTRFVVELYSDAKSLHNPVQFEKIKSCIEIVEPWFEMTTPRDQINKPCDH